MALKDKLKKLSAPLIGAAVLAAGISVVGFAQVSASGTNAQTPAKSISMTSTDTETSTASGSDTTTADGTKTGKGTRTGRSGTAEEDAALAAKATITADAAAKTATDANSGYTVDINHLEDEDGTILYEIKMTDASGNKLEVKVDAATGAILSSEVFTGELGKGSRNGTKSEEDADLAAKATITADAAAKTATDANSGYTVDINHLEDEDGTILYEIKMSDASGNRLEVKVDAATGAILSSEAVTGDMGTRTGGRDCTGAADDTAADTTEETAAAQT